MPDERILDCRGLTCPMPVVKTKRALAEMDQGILTVVVDNEISSRNVTRAAQRAGCTAEVERDETTFRVRIRKGEVPEEPQPQPAAQTAVLLTSDTLGRGDDALGAILMKAFLYALSQLPIPPAVLILANTGVRLAVEGSECLDSLRALADAGAQIIACGTCLDHLGLTGKVATGRAGDIYEIVEILTQSAKIVSP